LFLLICNKMIQYSIKKFMAIESAGQQSNRYAVVFGLHDTGAARSTIVQCIVPMLGNEDKSEGEICQMAFSGSFGMISGASGRLESAETVAPSWEVTGTMFVPDL
jgi:hypothetical protein